MIKGLSYAVAMLVWSMILTRAADMFDKSLESW